MKDIRVYNSLECKLDNIGFVKVKRNRSFTVPYRSGKIRHSVILVEKGKMNYSFSGNEENVLLGKGDMVFVPKDFPYVATYLEDGTVMNLFMFDADLACVSRSFSRPIVKKADTLTGAKNISSILHHSVNNPIYLASKIYELIYILGDTPVPPDEPSKYKRIIPAVENINRNYAVNRPLGFYAELCGMSESNFRKLFKEYTGSSFIEYRNHLRISEAIQLIDSGEFTVAEAAYATGFNNMSFFYEVYNKHRQKRG